jgi:hypothetical protein
MLWTIFVILLVLWLLGLVSSYTMGGFIHILLVIAVVILIINLIGGRRLCSPMKPAGIIGIILIIVGIIGFAYGGLGWNTEKKDAQLGPIEIKHQERHGIDFPPILSGLCVVGGIVLVVVGSRQA